MFYFFWVFLRCRIHHKFKVPMILNSVDLANEADVRNFLNKPAEQATFRFGFNVVPASAFTTFNCVQVVRKVLKYALDLMQPFFYFLYFYLDGAFLVQNIKSIILALSLLWLIPHLIIHM